MSNKKSLSLKDLEKDRQIVLGDIRKMDTNRVMAQGVLAYLNQKIKDLRGEENGT